MTHRHSQRGYIAFLMVAGALLFAPRLLIHAANPEDAGHHLIWLKTFAEAFWQGDLYPRWLTAMNGGLGSPSFYYYPPLVYWLGTLLSPLAALGGDGWWVAFASAALALAGSGVTCYLWLRGHLTPRLALVGALFYMLHPYHLGIDLYMRFALAELWAFVWFPLILMACEHTVAHPRRWPLLALSLGGLTLTHLPSALLFYPIPLAYGLWMAQPAERLSVAAATMAAILGGVAVAACYLFPALAHLDWVRIDTMHTANLHYSGHFLFGGTAAEGFEGRIHQLELTAALSLLLGLLAAHRLWSRGEARRMTLLWAGILFTALLFTTPLTRWVWDGLPLLSAIQFPWRLQTVMTVAFIALWSVMPRSRMQQAAYAFTFAIISLLPVALLALSGRVMPFDTITNEGSRLSLQYNIPPTYEHFPKTMPLDYLTDYDLKERLEEPQGIRWLEGGGAATVRQWDQHGIRLDIWSHHGGVVELNHFYFPAWRAKRSDGGELSLSPAETSGLMRMNIAPGRYAVQLALHADGWQRAGNWLSALAVFGLGIAILRQRRRLRL